MKRFIFLILLVFAAEVSSEELRGVWLRPPSDVNEIPKMLDVLKDSGFNAVFVETFYHGFTVSASSPIPTRPEFEGKDVLQIFVDESRKRDLEIHAWVEVFYLEVQTEKYPQYPKSSFLDENPEWVSKLKNGRETWESEVAHRFASPAHPEVRNLVVSYLKNLLQNYDLDGINLDYIRYCAGTEDAGYDEFTINKFKLENGFDPSNLTPDDSYEWKTWVDWREDQVTEFMKLVHEMKEETKPDSLLLVSVFPEYYDTRYKSHLMFQDWGRWGREGLVDAISLMAYGPTLESITTEVENSFQLVSGGDEDTQILPGLAIARKIKDDYSSPNHPPMKDQIESVRNMGISGHVTFCYQWIVDSVEGFETYKEIYGDSE